MTLDGNRDTIAAIATPAGRGGIGIVRLSGPEALAIAMPLLRLRAPLEAGRVRFCEVVDPAADGDAAKLDEAVVTWFAGPRSFTGEDVVEIAAHGSPVLLDFLLRSLVAGGARLAGPGEFTERAFLSGRLDLIQAEAVRDLIDAQTLYQARVAAQQLDGALSRRVAPIKRELIGLIARLEAGIDFAEDDTPTVSYAEFMSAAGAIAEELAALAGSFAHGRLVHGGLTLAIVGEPNVGKSSLFNRLVERDRAIVTAAPGTTRDLVTERISLSGIPVELVDTAGLRTGGASEPLDEAERIGIERSRAALADADLVLLVVDAGAAERGEGFTAEIEELMGSLAPERSIVVLNKSDLLGERSGAGDDLSQLPAQMGARVAKLYGRGQGCDVMMTSATSGEGVALLRAKLARQLQVPGLEGAGEMVTNLRQHQAVEAAHAGLRAALEAPAGMPHEMLLLDLYAGLGALDTLTGATMPDDILHLIFSTFCIGK